MTCVHKVRWSVKRPEDCRFRLSVSHYKDRIVAPDEYSGVTVVTPSDSEQVIATKDKLVRDDITVEAVSLETLEATENGTYTPASQGFSSVTVNVPSTGYDAGTLIYEGDFAEETGTWNVTALPNGNSFSFDKVVAVFSNAGSGYNSGFRQYWRSDLDLTLNHDYMFTSGGINYLSGAEALTMTETITVEDDTYISCLGVGHDASDPTNTKVSIQRKAHGGYNKITAYGWWSWRCPAGTHIKITGYNAL